MDVLFLNGSQTLGRHVALAQLTGYILACAKKTSHNQVNEGGRPGLMGG